MTGLLQSALFLFFAGLFGFSVTCLNKSKPAEVAQEVEVALPRSFQVVMAMGDRFLAANIATFRAMVASTANMDDENFKVLGEIQRDAAWLNPAHEDNYYIAAAILPWQGQFEAAQDVLAKAMAARPYDWQPAFYYGFNLYYFKKDPITAADALLRAAPGLASHQDRISMEGLAYAWYEKGYDPVNAIRLLETSAKTARTSMLRSYLLLRAERLRNLLKLQEAADAFSKRHGRSLRSLDELVKNGLIEAIPSDPLGIGYHLNDQGKPVLARQGGQK